MPISLTEILSTRVQKTGRVYATVRYTFADGAIDHKVILASSEADIAAHIQDAKETLEKAKRSKDAQQAVDAGSTDAFGDATENDVLYQYMALAFDEPDITKVYDLMAPVAPTLLALNLTAEEYAAMFEVDPKPVQKLLDRWPLLVEKAAAISEVKALKEADKAIMQPKKAKAT